MDDVELRFGLRRRHARSKAARNNEPAREGRLPAFRIGRESIERMQRNPNVARGADIYAGESRGRDADHDERSLVELDGLTDDPWIGGKAATPIPIAKNRDIRAIAIVARREEAPLLRSNAQNGEEVIGVAVALGQSGNSAGAYIHAVELNSAKDAGHRL